MIDRVLGGRYRLVSVLGRGGMATVYRAEDTLLGREVAVKLLDDALSSDAEFVARFEQEARAAARLNHPNIVAVFDIGGDITTRFIVMELVEGEDLKALIDREAPFPAARVVRLGIQLAEALAYAHGRGVVHRDVKPHNILITADERLKVTDFGIARALGAPSITQAGHVMGSVHYMAPEQARGEPATPAADVYSAGVVLFEMSTGRVPYQGTNPVAIAMQHERGLTEKAWAGVAIPPSLRMAIDRAMAIHLTDRLATAAELRQALQDPGSLAAQATRRVPVAPGAAPRPADWVAEAPPTPAARRPATRVAPPERRRGVPWPAVILIGALLFALAAFVPIALGGMLGGTPRRTATPTLTVRPTRELPGVAETVVEPTPLPADTPAPSAQPTATTIPAPTEAPLTDSTPTAEPSPSPVTPTAELATPTTPPTETPPPTPTAVPPTPTPEPPTAEPSPTVVLVPVPAVEGSTLELAKGFLETAGFTVVVEHVPDSESPDIVLVQNPPAGTPLAPGSQVLLTVSSGPPPVAVPNVEGKPLDEATAELEALGFTISVSEREDNEVGDGTVVDQTPNAGESAQPGTEIELVVAR